jgi:hypothetical protein
MRSGRAEDDQTIKLVKDDKIRRVVLCSGKVYYDLSRSARSAASTMSTLRVEQLYPFPAKALITNCPLQERRDRLVPGRAQEHGRVAVGTDKGPGGAGGARRRPDVDRRDREGRSAGWASRARDGKLTMADMQGGTFTISNGGVYGSLMSTPILNAPQSGILGMHKIQDRPVVVERPDRHPPDDVSGAELRPPHRRRQGPGDLPRSASRNEIDLGADSLRRGCERQAEIHNLMTA